MSLELWLTFVIASAILVAIPGPTILTVISYSIAHGRRANIPMVAAVALGDATALAFSLLGLGALLSASATLFTLIKWAGGLYLIFLGGRMLLGGMRAGHVNLPTAPVALKTVFLNTYLVTALNPKGIIFFVAFLPQFIDPRADPSFQLWVLALTFVVLAIINASFYALFASVARQALTSGRAQRIFNLLGGGLLCTAGVWALLAKRPGAG